MVWPMVREGDVHTIQEHATVVGLLAPYHVHMSFEWADIPSAPLLRQGRTAPTMTNRPAACSDGVDRPPLPSVTIARMPNGSPRPLQKTGPSQARHPDRCRGPSTTSECPRYLRSSGPDLLALGGCTAALVRGLDFPV